MSKEGKEGMDPSLKQAMKSKIMAEIEKMKAAGQKGDTEAQQKIMILNERIRLIDSYRPFDETRISSLEKLFKHYCVHTSQTGKRNMTFDRIIYENQHLTIQRFFAFINDFKLNQIPTEEGNKQLADRNKIILLFKQSSSNARNLAFPEFIICLQRLFVLLFTQTQNYDRKIQKLQAEKKKRLEQLKKREEKKKAKAMRKNKHVVPQQPQQGEPKAPEEGQGSSEEEEDEEDEKTKNQPLKQNNSIAKPNPGNLSQPKSTENDQMVKELMSNFEIVNPNDQVKKAARALKNQGDQKEEDDNQIEIEFDPYAISDQEKIQSYMLRLGVDNFKAMEKKMRYFEKANLRYNEADPLDKAMEVKKSKLKILKKDSLTHYENAQLHEEWSLDKKSNQQKRTKRLINVKDMIADRQLQKSKDYLASALPKQVYDQKRRRLDESFQKRQHEQMGPIAKARATKTKEQEEERNLQYSLEMVNRSTPNQLPFNKINPQRYIGYDPSDRIFLQEFGSELDLTFRGRIPREMGLVESTKRRARQLQNQQAKRLNQITQNRFKNPHYLQKFLQRKW